MMKKMWNEIAGEESRGIVKKGSPAGFHMLQLLWILFLYFIWNEFHEKLSSFLSYYVRIIEERSTENSLSRIEFFEPNELFNWFFLITHLRSLSKKWKLNRIFRFNFRFWVQTSIISSSAKLCESKQNPISIRLISSHFSWWKYSENIRSRLNNF